jgi:hypothetical protein
MFLIFIEKETDLSQGHVTCQLAAGTNGFDRERKRKNCFYLV